MGNSCLICARLPTFKIGLHLRRHTQPNMLRIMSPRNCSGMIQPQPFPIQWKLDAKLWQYQLHWRYDLLNNIFWLQLFLGASFSTAPQSRIVNMTATQSRGTGLMWCEISSGKLKKILQGIVVWQKGRFDLVRATEILSSGSGQTYTATRQHSTTPEHSTILVVNAYLSSCKLWGWLMRIEADANSGHGSVLKMLMLLM